MIVTPERQIREYRERGWWGTRTLLDAFDDATRATPATIALVNPPNRVELDGAPPRRLTWTELSAAVERLASGLLSAGVGRDDVVMVQLPNVVELAILYLAVGRIGAILSPLPMQFRAHELRQVLAVTAPRAFITTARFAGASFLDQILALRADHPSLATVLGMGDELPAGVLPLAALADAAPDRERLRAHAAAHPLSADDVLTICWTSGTEAEPKGVPRSHNHWIAIAQACIDGCALGPGSVLLNPFPLVNMSALGGMLTPWLLVGGTLVLHHPLSLPVLLEQIAGEKVRYTVVPPAVLNLLLLKPELLAHADLGSLKTVGSGSAPLSPWMVTEFQQHHGIAVVNIYGSNEGAALLSGPAEIPDPAERAELFPRFGAGGFTWKNRITLGLSTRLVEPTSGEEIVEAGLPGELRVRGPAIFSGYFRRPELTAGAFDDAGYFKTGDLFTIAASQSGALDRYRFVGRLKDVVVRGGTKISSEEVEALLAAHPAVADVAVVGYSDAILGERVCAVVVPRPGQTVDLEGLAAFLGEEVAPYKIPERLMIVDALPRNPLGKVLKRVLRERLRQPPGPLEQR